jgi:hypothetical protein
MSYTFFQLFIGIVDHSGLSQAQIVRRTNELAAKDVMWSGYDPIHPATLSRLYRGIDIPPTHVLYRIARFGLTQNAKQCRILEQLRQKERETHTTSHHTVIKVPTTDELQPLKAELREA